MSRRTKSTSRVYSSTSRYTQRGASRGSYHVSTFAPLTKMLTGRSALKPNRVGLGGRRGLLGPVRESQSPAPAAVTPRQRPIPPASLEAEHRGVMVVVSQTLREIRNFQSTYKNLSTDYEGMQKSAKDILQNMNINELEVETCADFKRIFKDYKMNSISKKHSEYDQLESYCDKGIKFQDMIVTAKDRLKETYDNHLKKYFLSFVQEVNNSGVKSANDYEENINNHQTDISSMLETLNEDIERFSELKCPFVGSYLGEGAKIGPLIEEVCVRSLSICDLMKRWTHEDRHYPARLWDEIISSNISRSKMVEELKKQKRKQEEMDHQKQRKKIASDKVKGRWDEVMREKRKTTVNRVQLTERCDNIQEEINSLYASQCENEENIKNRKSNSPSYLEALFQQSEKLKIDIARLEQRLDTFKRQIERFSKSEEDSVNTAAALERELEIYTNNIDLLDTKVADYGFHMEDMRKELVIKEARIAAAKKIRDIKLSPSTLRKIFYQRLGVAVRDKLGDACKLVSQFIGRSWRELYLELPFRPPRDKDKRITDSDKVYTTCLHKDQEADEQAWQSLMKWRTFHRHGNVQQLVKSLKKIHKFTIARHVEEMQISHTA